MSVEAVGLLPAEKIEEPGNAEEAPSSIEAVTLPVSPTSLEITLPPTPPEPLLISTPEPDVQPISKTGPFFHAAMENEWGVELLEGRFVGSVPSRVATRGGW